MRRYSLLAHAYGRTQSPLRRQPARVSLSNAHPSALYMPCIFRDALSRSVFLASSADTPTECPSATGSLTIGGKSLRITGRCRPSKVAQFDIIIRAIPSLIRSSAALSASFVSCHVILLGSKLYVVAAHGPAAL